MERLNITRGIAVETRARQALVVTGGLCRLLGAALHLWPPRAMRFGLFMELVATPALCAWQARIAASSPR